jgi:SAM-dependent methyltransferase
MEQMKPHYKKPTGELGRKLATMMNQQHGPLSLWGLAHIHVQKDFVILDVGCGGGKMIKRLAHLAYEGKIFGIDHSKDMVEYSKNLNKDLIAKNRVEILEESVEKMSFQDDFINLATAVETCYFWPSLEEGLREIKRVLKPGGKLLIVNEFLKNGSANKEDERLIRDIGGKLFGLNEICDEMAKVGFTEIKVFLNQSRWSWIARRERWFWNAVLAVKLNSKS